MTEGVVDFAADNEFFKRMLDLVPPIAYFDKEVQQQLKSKTEFDGKEEKNGIDKESSRERKKKSKKDKQRKEVNVFLSKTVTQIQEENLAKLTQNNFTEVKIKKNKIKKQKKEMAAPVVTSTPAVAAAPTASSSGGHMDNRAKLRAKIEELQAKRNMSEITQETKRQRRKEQKMKRKAKSQENKKKQKLNREQKNIESKGENSKQPKTPTKPIYNKEGNLVYSKFDFTSTGKKKRNSDLTGKDYKRLLEKIEKRNEKLTKLKGRNEAAAVNLQEKFKWDAAFSKAEGEKVKDNPELLKKSLKRKEKIREKKKKKWDTRVKNVEKDKDIKQVKRTKNINARKQTKKDNKMKKLQKKGRLIPGY